MFHEVSEMHECGSEEMHMGDMWRYPPNFREIHGVYHVGGR